MTTNRRRVWQISGGPANRSYSDIFLKYGVALIGPGDWGPWDAKRYPGGESGPWYYDDFSIDGFVRRFATEVNIGDVFLLRTGISTIRAVGIVASEYLYLNQFDDVNGWDLQHARRVRWFELPEEHTFASQVFGANPPRFSRTENEDVLNYVDRFINSPPTYWQNASLPQLPQEEPDLKEIPTALKELVACANDLVPLMWDRHVFGERPSEDEMIAHFVVPFLRALGWPQEYIALKWHWVDVAVFRTLPRTPQNCQFLIEAKRLGAGVEGALEQVIGYVKSLGVPLDVVVTDGIRYRMYSCVAAGANATQADQWEFEPVAYANLTRLKKSAKELFARMTRP
jgi:hypothetical protein